MEAIESARKERVQQLIRQTREILDREGLNRDRLNDIRELVHALAQERDLWMGPEFPAPEDGVLHNRFLIDAESDDGITLYLNIMCPGKIIKPHNHTTWACIAAVDGMETNTLYDRTDDGTVEGRSNVELTETIDLGPGTSIALMPDDIHSVSIFGTTPIKHLHLYGRPLEKLTQRKTFDIENGSHAIMDIGVQTKTK